MLVLMLEVQKGCNGDVDTCISVIQTIHTIIHLSEHLNLHRTPQPPPNTSAQPPDQRGLDSWGCTDYHNDVRAWVLQTKLHIHT